MKKIIIIFMLIVTPYIWNAYKFAGCDFEANYKCEVVHGIGVFMPPAAYITVWFASEGGD